MLARLGLVAMFALALPAQPARDWTSLSSTLSAGSEIQVKTSGKETLRGQFASADADTLALTTSKGEQRVARAMVSRVAVKKKNHRLRNMAIGLGAGAAGGLAVGAAGDAQCNPHCFFGNNLGKEVVTPAGAFAGLIVGLVWPTGGWREIYRAP